MVSKQKQKVVLAKNGTVDFKCSSCDKPHYAKLRAWMVYEGNTYSLDTAGNWSQTVMDGRLFNALNDAFEQETGLPVIEETIQ
jgi:hypothetical protein